MNLKRIILQVIILQSIILLTACITGSSDEDTPIIESKVVDQRCLIDSDFISDDSSDIDIISSKKCGTTKKVDSYIGYENFFDKPVSGQVFPVTVDYKVFEPTVNPEALILLFTGGQGNAGIDVDPEVEEVSNQNNFLVRSAQVFAEKGYLAIIVDQPSVGDLLVENNGKAYYDLYRVSQFQSMDIVNILAAENTDSLPVYFMGTSRGAISAYSQSRLANGVSLSSPVTVQNQSFLYLGFSDESNEIVSLTPDYVSVPTQIVAHKNDNCSVSPHDEAYEFFQSITQVETEFVDEFGEKESLGDLTNNPCNAKTNHGFIGIENAVVGKMTDWVKTQVDLLNQTESFPVTLHKTYELKINEGNTVDILLNELITGDIQNSNIATLYPMSLYNAILTVSNNQISYEYDREVVNDFTDKFIYLVKSSDSDITNVKYGIVTINVNMN